LILKRGSASQDSIIAPTLFMMDRRHRRAIDSLNNFPALLSSAACLENVRSSTLPSVVRISILRYGSAYQAIPAWSAPRSIFLSLNVCHNKDGAVAQIQILLPSAQVKPAEQSLQLFPPRKALLLLCLPTILGILVLYALVFQSLSAQSRVLARIAQRDTLQPARW
jgi:hypothetical protein